MLLIVIDTLRFDRLGSYGNERGLTPFLDSLADRSHVFRRAYAQSSWTSPSVASLLTSRYQSQHGVISFGSELTAQEVTLAEVLKEHGYATSAYSANFLLRPKLGYQQGFDEFELLFRPNPGASDQSRFRKGRADSLNRAALEWLDGVAPDVPAFLYLQYMEPHNPYDPPDEFVEAVLDGEPRPDLEHVNGVMNLALAAYDEETVRAVATYYDAEVMSLDADLRKLFGALEERGFLDEAVVVVTADHGEELNEHGRLGHHKTLYEEVIRVPLLIHVPGQQRRWDVEESVSLVDVAPTVLDLAGIERPQRFAGRSLAPLMEAAPGAGGWGAVRDWLRGDERGAGHLGVSELIKPADARRPSPHLRAIVAGTDKIVAGVGGEREFYDLRTDPGEVDANALSRAERSDLAAHLIDYEASVQGLAASSPQAGEIDDEIRARMRALGYVE